MEIVLLTQSTLDEQVQVYCSAFEKGSSFEVIKAHWVKKHYKNPIENSLIFGAFDGDRLIGLNAYLPSIYRVGEKKYYVLQSCESGVLPAYRGKGVWSKIVRFAVEYISNNTRYEGIMGFPNYRNSYPGFKKMGWNTLYQMDNYLLVNNASKFAESIFGGNSVLGFVAGLAVMQRIPIFVFSLFQNRYQIRECFVNEALWNIPDEPALTIDHSEAWCKWKADYKQLRCLLINKSGEPLASCIYGIDMYEGHEVIRLDQFSNNGRTHGSRRLLSLALAYLKKRYPNAAFVRTWTMPRDGRIFRKLMFIKSSHPNPFILIDTKGNLKDLRWSLSFFDLD